MKLRYLLLFSPLAFCANAGNAQIAIGTSTPSASAILDLTSTTQGLLPPRMNTSQMGGIATPATGLAVFNSDSGAYCIYTGTAWVKMLTSISRPTDTISVIQDADRNTSVATGTSAADDKIHFTLGGTERFTMNKGTLELNNTGAAVYIGNAAGSGDNYSANTYNTGVGNNALQNANFNSRENVGVGYKAGQQITSGYENTLVGTNAGYFCTSGSYNTAIGYSALHNTAGSNNTVLGYDAGLMTTGGGNVFLGYQSGYNEAGSNKLYIANSSITTPLLYGDFSNRALTVNDSLRAKYFLMSNGAAAGYILKSDAGGNAAWTNPLSIRTDTLAVISDSDANTKVVAGSVNTDDKIHFTLGGSERFTMSRGTLEWNNTGGSVYLGNSSGQTDNYTSAAGNVGVGANTLQFATSSTSDNTAVGRYALQQTTTSYENAAFGTSAGRYGTGVANTAIGAYALANNITGLENVAVGHGAGQSASGSNNVLIGNQAGIVAGSGNVFIGNEAGNNEFGSNKLYIANSTTSQPLLYGEFNNSALKVNGKLGIGTLATKAPLEIGSNVSTGVGGFAYYSVNSSSTSTGYSSGGTFNFSIWASDRIAAVEFNAFSDARIKHIIDRSSGATDLATLMQLRITDYRHIDMVAHGNGISKKVIAQEVEAVYPNAVKQTVNEIPDIYKLATIKDGIVRVANTLKKGEKVKLIFSGRTELAEVLEADATSFKVALNDEGQVFVYGRQVADFRTVDYEALTTLNISATQELVRKIEALEKSSASVLQKLEALSAEVEKLNTKGVSTVTSR